MSAAATTDDATATPRSMATFLWLWGTQGLATVGSALATFATTTWLATVRYPAPEDRGALAAAVAAQFVAWGVPLMLLTPLAGAWADARAPRAVMRWAAALSLIPAAALAALAFRGALGVAWLCVLYGALAALAAFHGAAFAASYVQIVPERHLPRAHALVQTNLTLAALVAPALGAGIAVYAERLRAGGAGWMADATGLALTVHVVTGLVALVALLCLRIPTPPRAPPADALGLETAADGWRFVRRHPALLRLLGLVAAVNLLASGDPVLVPLMAKVNLAADAARHGLEMEGTLAALSAAGSAGALAGGALMVLWGGLGARRVRGVVLALVAIGALQAAFGCSATLVVAAVVAFAMGVADPVFNAHSATVWQLATPPHMQGRVYAVRYLVAMVAGPLSLVGAGWLGGRFDAGHVFAACGALLLLVGVTQLPARRWSDLGDAPLGALGPSVGPAGAP